MLYISTSHRAKKNWPRTLQKNLKEGGGIHPPSVAHSIEKVVANRINIKLILGYIAILLPSSLDRKGGNMSVVMEHLINTDTQIGIISIRRKYLI